MPKFLEALRKGGADVLRLDAYVTQPGCLPDQCTAEMTLLRDGEIDAIVFSSIAEVSLFLHFLTLLEKKSDVLSGTRTGDCCRWTGKAARLHSGVICPVSSPRSLHSLWSEPLSESRRPLRLASLPDIQRSNCSTRISLGSLKFWFIAKL